MFHHGAFAHQFNPNAVEFHPGINHSKKVYNHDGATPRKELTNLQSSPWNSDISKQAFINSYDFWRSYNDCTLKHRQNWPNQNASNRPSTRIVSSQVQDEFTTRVPRQAAIKSSYIEAITKFTELRTAGLLTPDEDEYYKTNLGRRLISSYSASAMSDIRALTLGSGQNQRVNQNGNRDPKPTDEQTNRKRNFSMVSVDKNETVVSECNETKDITLISNMEESEDIYERIRPVMVHFSGVDRDDSPILMDFKIICKDGDIQANKELLTSASAYFYQLIGASSKSVAIYDFEAHETRMLVELVTKGRVAILKGRLCKFMKTLMHFKVLGVFHSESNEYDERSAVNFTTVKSSIPIESSPTRRLPYTLLPRVTGMADKVRCNSCNNVLLESVFCEHYKEYHLELCAAINCCGEEFATKYEHVQHGKKNCTKHKNAVTAEPNFSVIDNSESSAVDVNMNVKRPNANIRSTLIGKISDL